MDDTHMHNSSSVTRYSQKYMHVMNHTKAIDHTLLTSCKSKYDLCMCVYNIEPDSPV